MGEIVAQKARLSLAVAAERIGNSYNISVF